MKNFIPVIIYLVTFELICDKVKLAFAKPVNFNENEEDSQINLVWPRGGIKC